MAYRVALIEPFLEVAPVGVAPIKAREEPAVLIGALCFVIIVAQIAEVQKGDGDAGPDRCGREKGDPVEARGGGDEALGRRGGLVGCHLLVTFGLSGVI